MYTIIGIRIEKYIGTVTEGHNCDFEEVPEELERVIIFLTKGGRKYKLTLYTEYGQCYSGWTTASFGHGDLVEVQNFECGFTHVPKEYAEVDNLDNNKYFSWDSDGGDEYYPSGGHNINMDYFVATGRQAEKPVVFIFTGPSAIGKSFIASKIKELQVYETDSSDTLNIPKTTGIVVLGGKYNYTIENVKEQFANLLVEFRLVNFSKL